MSNGLFWLKKPLFLVVTQRRLRQVEGFAILSCRIFLNLCQLVFKFFNYPQLCFGVSVILLNFSIISSVSAMTYPSGFDPYKDTISRDKLGQVGTRSLYYLSDQYQNPKAKSVQLFETRIVRAADENDFSLGIDLEGQFSVSQKMFNSFTSNEFYFRMDPLWSGATLYLGRKRSNWSTLDDRWKLGVWQPTYKIDALNPHTQGLTGLFVNFKKDNWTLEFFGTPFFLPDHGPEVQTRNGEFEKGHPWVQYPPSEVILNGVVTPAYYHIESPSIPEVIVNTGYGMNLQWGEFENEGWMAQAAYAYKPLNQLLLGFDGDFNFTERLEINVHPQVGFHRVASLDGSYRSENWSTYVGLIEDRPDRTSFEAPWTFQNFKTSHLVGAGIDYFTSSIRLGFSVIHREGGESVVEGPRASLTNQVLPDRFLFQDLVKAELSYSGDLGARWSYELMGEWRREIREKSEIVSGQGALLMGPFWKAFLGIDLLKSENKVAGKADFINSYQANDRVYGGLQYAF